MTELSTLVNDLEVQVNYLNIEMENIYEHVFGDDGIERYEHDELITMLDEMYDCYKYVIENVYNKGEYI